LVRRYLVVSSPSGSTGRAAILAGRPGSHFQLPPTASSVGSDNIWSRTSLVAEFSFTSRTVVEAADGTLGDARVAVIKFGDVAFSECSVAFNASARV